MKQINEIMLTVVSAVILVILSACSTVDTTDNNQRVADTASKIADFEPPAGYTPEFSAEMLGFTTVSYRGTTRPSHLYLIQSGKQSNDEELQNMLKDLAPGSSDPNTRMTVIENRTVTVRGQDVDVIISEGLNSADTTYREATVVFQGKGGPVLLVYSESLDLWDQATVDSFLESIQ